MPRIGTVIREVYHRPGADALPILRYLERRVFPAERCAHSSPVTELDGRAVLVTGYLPGSHPSGSPAVWRTLGDLLGRLHTLPAEPGPVFVDWTGAGTGPRLASLAGLLHSAGPWHAPAALGGYREHIQLTADELDRLEGVLWIRILWLSAWQCWLACVSAKVHQGFYPRREYITALAATVRAHSGRPA